MKSKDKSIVRFIVLSHARSGSTLLMDALGQHPCVLNCDELFEDSEEDRPKLPLAFRHQNPSLPSKYWDAQPAGEFLQDIFYKASYPASIAAVGCKLFNDQCRGSAAARTIWTFLQSSPEIRVIQLFRQNLLEAWVSLQTALQTGQWHLGPLPGGAGLEKPIELPPFTVAIPAFEAYANEILAFMEESKRTLRRHPMLQIEYFADLCTKFPESTEQIYNFLSLPKFSPRARVAKLARRPLSARITNLDEIQCHFRNKPLISHISFSTSNTTSCT